VKRDLTVATSTSYDECLSALVDEEVASRLAAQDPTLWGAEAESEASIRLSWVGLPVSSRPLLAEIDALRAQLWSEGIDRVVLCGMGGSSLAPEVISRTYDVPLQILDSTNPSAVHRAVSADLARTVVVVSSKSGSTLETDSQRRAFAGAFEAAGISAASRFVVVTDPGSELERLATDEGYRKIFLADPNVGGRYSALTAFGLVPSGLAGIDVAELLDEAEAVMQKLAGDTSDNPALVLAAGLVANDGRDKLAIADADSGIVGFADWAEQLVAESTGKQGRGLLPVAVEGLNSPEVSSNASDVVLAALTAQAGPAVDGHGKPVVTVSGTLGAQLLTWETATAVAGRILGINPFDQPDVESAKKAARALLDETIAEAVETLLGRLDDDSYLAVMPYLDPHRDQALRAASVPVPRGPPVSRTLPRWRGRTPRRRRNDAGEGLCDQPCE